MLLFNYNKICFLNTYVFSVNLQHCNNLCIRIFINNVVKCTKMYSLQSQNTQFGNDKKKTIIKFDEVKYFSVQVMLKFSSRYKNEFVSNMLINCIFEGDRKETKAVPIYFIFYSILFMYFKLINVLLKKWRAYCKKHALVGLFPWDLTVSLVSHRHFSLACSSFLSYHLHLSLVSLGCYNKLLQIGGLNNRCLFLTFLEKGKQDQGAGRSSVWRQPAS